VASAFAACSNKRAEGFRPRGYSGKPNVLRLVTFGALAASRGRAFGPFKGARYAVTDTDGGTGERYQMSKPYLEGLVNLFKANLVGVSLPNYDLLSRTIDALGDDEMSNLRSKVWKLVLKELAPHIPASIFFDLSDDQELVGGLFMAMLTQGLNFDVVPTMAQAFKLVHPRVPFYTVRSPHLPERARGRVNVRDDDLLLTKLTHLDVDVQATKKRVDKQAKKLINDAKSAWKADRQRQVPKGDVFAAILVSNLKFPLHQACCYAQTQDCLDAFDETIHEHLKCSTLAGLLSR